jgi:hypothetical protein
MTNPAAGEPILYRKHEGLIPSVSPSRMTVHFNQPVAFAINHMTVVKAGIPTRMPRLR